MFLEDLMFYISLNSKDTALFFCNIDYCLYLQVSSGGGNVDVVRYDVEEFDIGKLYTKKKEKTTKLLM